MTKVVNVLSPETLHCGKADGFHLSEGNMVYAVRGEARLFPRGLRQCYDVKGKQRELGRTLSVCLVAKTGIGNEPKRRESDGAERVVGFLHSSVEAGNDRGAKGGMFMCNVMEKQGQPL